MEISPGIETVDTALYLKQYKILIMNDLHIGYEGELHRKGILVPRFQLKEILNKVQAIIDKTQPKTIIINGDLKHEFGTILKEEWKEGLLFLDFLLQRCTKIIIVQGNHDPIIKPIAAKRNVIVVKEYKIDEIHIVHGDELVKTDAKTIIIGHEHPAIAIREGSKIEKFKCFLKGTWNRKQIIAVPSFNPLLEGTNILEGSMLSPFLQKIDGFTVFIVGKGETFNFGRVKDLQQTI